MSTCLDDGPVVHEDHQVRPIHKLYAVSAKDSGLSPQDSHDAFLHQVLSHLGVHGRQGVIQQVDVLLLIGQGRPSDEAFKRR